MVLNQAGNDCSVFLRQTHSWANVRKHLDAYIGMVTWVPLANVVEERTEHEQVGPRHSVDKRSGISNRLP